MLEIKRGSDKFLVPKGAFKDIFEKQGYKVVSGADEDYIQPLDVKPDTTAKEDSNEETDVDEWEGADDAFSELKEKPISGWSKKEVKEYADYYEIDLSGAKSVEEMKKIVKEYL